MTIKINNKEENEVIVIESGIDESKSSEIPEEVLIKILSYLHPKELCKSAQTCKLWGRVSNDDSLWQETLKKYLNLDDSSHEIPYKDQIKEIQIFRNRKYSVNNLKIKLCKDPIEGELHPSEIENVLTTKSGLTCLVTNQGDLKVWDLNSSKCLKCLEFKDSTKEDNLLCHLSERMDGTILMGFENGTFCILDLENLKILKTFNLNEEIDDILELKDGRIAYLSNGNLYLYDIQNNICPEIQFIQSKSSVREFSQLNDTTLLICRGSFFLTYDLKNMQIISHNNMSGSVKKIGDNTILNDQYCGSLKELAIYSFDPSKKVFKKMKLIKEHGHQIIDFFPLTSHCMLCKIDGDLRILDLRNESELETCFDQFNLPRNLSMRDCFLSYPRGRGKLFIIPKKLSQGCATISVVDFMPFKQSALAHIAHNFREAYPLSDRETPLHYGIGSSDGIAFYDILPRFKLMDVDDQNAIYAEFYKIIRPLISNDYWGIAQQVFENLDKTVQVTHQQRAQAIENFLISQGYDLDSLNSIRNVVEPDEKQTLVIEDPITNGGTSPEAAFEIEDLEHFEWLKLLNISSKKKCSDVLNVSMDFLDKVGLSSIEDLKALGIDFETTKTILNLKEISESFLKTLEEWKQVSKALMVHEQYENFSGFIQNIENIADVLDKKIVTLEKILPHANPPFFLYLDNVKRISAQLHDAISKMHNAKESQGSLKAFICGDQINEICSSFTKAASELAEDLVWADQWILHTYLHQWGIYSEVWKKLKETNEQVTLSQLKAAHPDLSIEDFFAMAANPVF